MEKKRINVFLASSITDMQNERNAIGNFFRHLNDRYEDQGRDISFRLHMCEDISDEIARVRKQDEYNGIIEKCEYFYVMFWHRAGEYTIEEFDVAYKSFLESGTPHIMTFFKNATDGNADASVLSFMERLDKGLQHYYTKFEHIDSVKLKILLHLANVPELDMKLGFEDGVLKLNNNTFEGVSLDNIPAYANHEAISRLRTEYAELDKEYRSACKKMLDAPGDLTASSHCLEIGGKYNKVREELHKLEMGLLEVSQRLVKMGQDGEYMTERSRLALALYDEGRADDAIRILDINELRADIARADELSDTVKRRYSAYLQEYLVKIDILTSKGITKENAEEIKTLYEEARALVLAHDLDCTCILRFVNFLHHQCDYRTALEVGEKLYYYLKSKDWSDLSFLATCYDSLALIYRTVNRIEEAEKLYIESLDIYRSLEKKSLEAYIDSVATVCNNLGVLYSDMGRSEEAETLYVEALTVYRRLAKENPDVYISGVARVSNNLGRIYEDTNRIKDAEKLYLEAYNILCESTVENFVVYTDTEEVITISNNLARIYQDIDRVKDAEKLCIEALDLYHKFTTQNPYVYVKPIFTTCNILAEIAMSYEEVNLIEDAERLYIKAHDIYNENGAKYASENRIFLTPTQILVCIHLANIYSDNDKMAEARKLVLEAFKICKALKDFDKISYEMYEDIQDLLNELNALETEN